MKSDLLGKGNDLTIGIAWAVSFLIFRILPMPYILCARRFAAVPLCHPASLHSHERTLLASAS